MYVKNQRYRASASGNCRALCRRAARAIGRSFHTGNRQSQGQCC
jgi:hypothetical protein